MKRILFFPLFPYSTPYVEQAMAKFEKPPLNSKPMHPTTPDLGVRNNADQFYSIPVLCCIFILFRSQFSIRNINPVMAELCTYSEPVRRFFMQKAKGCFVSSGRNERVMEIMFENDRPTFPTVSSNSSLYITAWIHFLSHSLRKVFFFPPPTFCISNPLSLFPPRFRLAIDFS